MSSKITVSTDHDWCRLSKTKPMGQRKISSTFPKLPKNRSESHMRFSGRKMKTICACLSAGLLKSAHKGFMVAQPGKYKINPGQVYDSRPSSFPLCLDFFHTRSCLPLLPEQKTATRCLYVFQKALVSLQ